MAARIGILSLGLALAFALGGCSREQVLTEGKARYVRYQLADQDFRYLSSLTKEEDNDRGSASIERYESDPYVRVWPGYVEISYTHRAEGKEPERITHFIPQEKLINLRWLDSRH